MEVNEEKAAEATLIDAVVDEGNAVLHCEGDGIQFLVFLSQSQSWGFLQQHFSIDACADGIALHAVGDFDASQLAKELRQVYIKWRKESGAA